MKQIREEEYQVTKWSGGTTTQLFIWPLDGDYQSRQFDIRISSATVEEEPSLFTCLPGVHRFISVLEGELEVFFEDRPGCKLKPFQIEAFEGDWKTTSTGLARDFNLMVKKGTGAMQALEFKGELCLKGKDTLHFLYVAEGSLEVSQGQETCVLSQGESLYTMEDQDLKLSAAKKCHVMYCKVTGVR